MSISNRVQRLEDALGVGGRLIVMSRPRDMSDEHLERYLHSHGVSTRSNDLIVSLKRFGNGHPDPWVKVDSITADAAINPI